MQSLGKGKPGAGFFSTVGTGLVAVRFAYVWPDDGVVMSNPDPDPRPWACECGNVLGVMHRNSNHIMLLDAFRVRVTGETLRVALTAFSQRDYSVKNLGVGDVPCAACGRLNAWDASEQLLKRFLKQRKERNEKTDAIINSEKPSARPERAPSD